MLTGSPKRNVDQCCSDHLFGTPSSQVSLCYLAAVQVQQEGNKICAALARA